MAWAKDKVELLELQAWREQGLKVFEHNEVLRKLLRVQTPLSNKAMVSALLGSSLGFALACLLMCWLQLHLSAVLAHDFDC